MLDLLPVTVTPSATSVALSWYQSLTGTNYTISLTRVTGVGNGQVLCDNVTDEKSIETSAISQRIRNLEEFSNYTVTITAKFHGSLKIVALAYITGFINTTFTTLSACTIYIA